MSPNLSVIMPVFNGEKYLRKTLDSIIAQTYKHFELIISDDSSSEDVSQLLKDHSDKLSFHYVRNTPGLGSSQNWNHAISLAKGRWYNTNRIHSSLGNKSIKEFAKSNKNQNLAA
jgi:glycosyltransferase involved in cell wall biosynthesis